MAVEVGPVISFLSQRIVAAPPEVQPPRAFGRGTPVRRFREGLIEEPQFRRELQELGYGPEDIERALDLARLEREYDLFQDRLRVVQEAFEKDLITFEEMKSLVLDLVPDEQKALTLVDLYDFRKRPRPRRVAAEEPPTLSVGRLLAAFRAGVLTREALRLELGMRGYTPQDIDLLVATEEARLPKPRPERRRQLTMGDLRAMFDLGILTAQEFHQELLDRGFSPEDADRILSLQQARQRARLAKPTAEEFRALPLGDLRAMFTLGIISEAELRDELTARDFSPEDVDREVALILARMAPQAP